jgi:hypothetical protein
MNRPAHISFAQAVEGLMKTRIEQVKGLGAWYVAISELGRDRFGSDGRARVAQKCAPVRGIAVAGRSPTSGLMTLLAVCESEGRASEIVDFEWAYVSPLAARLLDCEPRELIGHRLLSVMDDEREGAALRDHYRNVVAQQACEPITQAHVVDGCLRMLRHSALRLGEGVLVTLSDVSTTLEQDAPRFQWQRLDGAFAHPFDSTQAGT